MRPDRIQYMPGAVKSQNIGFEKISMPCGARDAEPIVAFKKPTENPVMMIV
jgi:hypothetical protein